MTEENKASSPVAPSLIPKTFRNEEGEEQTTCANCAKPIIKSGDKWIHKYGWMKECISDKIVATPAATSPSLIPEQELCVLCGHNGVAPDGTCMVPVPICSDDYHGTRRCGCKCKFAAATPSTATAARLSLDDTGHDWYHVVREDKVVDGCREVIYSSSDRAFCELLINAVNTFPSAVPVEQPEGELPIEDLERDHYRDHPPDVE